MKRIVLFAICISLTAVAFAQQDTIEQQLKPWTDVIQNSTDPASWRWNKNESSRFAIRGDWDGDGFDEWLYEGATKLFSDNKDITPLDLGGDLGVYFLINEGDLDGDGGDEVSLMRVNREYTNWNRIGIYSYNGYRWVEIFNVRAHLWDAPNYQGKNAEENFTHEWKRKNGFSNSKVVLKKHDGIIDVINVNEETLYAIEEIKIISKTSTKRKFTKVIEPKDW